MEMTIRNGTFGEDSVAQYLPELFKLSAAVIIVVGTHWFESDPDFLLLLASLSSARLALAFHGEVAAEEAVVIGRLHCHFVRCGEEAEFLKEQHAEKLSNVMHNSACYTCEYVLKFPDVKKELAIAMYEFLCIYINFGGLETLSSDFTNNLGAALLSVCGIFQKIHLSFVRTNFRSFQSIM
ncbi:unnamed protein product [Gongylonema pulchrum]|uniref:WASH-7_N domain-containing protein n=1 Tax=Gongylonema pulchrum TaxID=637853 RepID=A0A183E4Y4_9BILA|nr:unnamed protein product [Gongylonema pulchrum]